MSTPAPPSYADKVKQSLEQAGDLGRAPVPSGASAESISRSTTQVQFDRPSVSEKPKGPGAVYAYVDRDEQAAQDRYGPNYTPESESSRTETAAPSERAEGAPSLTTKTKEQLSETKEKLSEAATTAKDKLSGANESLKTSVSQTQEKLHEALSGGIQQQAGRAWGQTKDPDQPGLIDRLTTSIAEGSKKVTETAQSVKEGVKSSLGLGGGGQQPGQQQQQQQTTTTTETDPFGLQTEERA